MTFDITSAIIGALAATFGILLVVIPALLMDAGRIQRLRNNQQELTKSVFELLGVIRSLREITPARDRRGRFVKRRA